MKLLEDSDNKSKKNVKHTCGTFSNSQITELLLEYHNSPSKVHQSADRICEVDTDDIQTFNNEEYSGANQNLQTTSILNLPMHLSNADTRYDSNFSDKNLNYNPLDNNAEQLTTQVWLDEVLGSMVEIGKGTIFCSNTSLDSTANYSSTLGDSTILADSTTILNDSTKTSTSDNKLADDTAKQWISGSFAGTDTLYNYKKQDDESNGGTPRERNENMRPSLLFLSSWELDEDNLKYDFNESMPSPNFFSSPNNPPLPNNSPFSNSVKKSRITEPTPEKPNNVASEQNFWNSASFSPIDKIEDNCKLSDAISIGENNQFQQFKLNIFHKTLKPIGIKYKGDNFNIGLYFILQQGGIDSNNAKSILLDADIKMNMHYEFDCNYTDAFTNQCDAADCSHNNVKFKNWYDQQLEKLYQKYKGNLTENQAPSTSTLAKLISAADWSGRDCVKRALNEQNHWNPFSIFGSAPPSVYLPDIFDYNFYKKLAPLEALKTNAVFKCLSNMEQINIDDGLNDSDWPKVKEYLEKRWNNQASLDCDWNCDELEINEVFWYLDIMGKYQDKSQMVYSLEPCYCVTPDPQLCKGLMWNDPRCNPVYPRPSIYHPDKLDRNMIYEMFVNYSTSSHEKLAHSSSSIDDLPDTPEMIENPECSQRDELSDLYSCAFQQIPVYPYHRHRPYTDHAFHYPQYCQISSPCRTFRYHAAAAPVISPSAFDSPSAFIGHSASASASTSVGVPGVCTAGKRRTGLHQYEYQPARVKHKLNILRQLN